MDQLNGHRGYVAARGGGGVLGVVIALDPVRLHRRSSARVHRSFFPAAAMDHGALRPPGTKTTCNCECTES